MLDGMTSTTTGALLPFGLSWMRHVSVDESGGVSGISVQILGDSIAGMEQHDAGASHGVGCRGLRRMQRLLLRPVFSGQASWLSVARRRGRMRQRSS